MRFDGLKVVVDCANGAAYQVAPSAIWELGADVVALGVTPNGININDGVDQPRLPSLPSNDGRKARDIGIALDGDADRRHRGCDEKGQVVDGDQIMALIAGRMHEKGALSGGGIVATVMSNLGLERYLATRGLTLERAKVGDRYVLEAMKAGGFNVGGEQSGHMILLDHATTGDGTVAALRVLASLVRSGLPASELLHVFEPVPQLLKNVRYEGGQPLENAAVQAVIAAAEARTCGKGRLVIRPSGTEPVIRVMAEGDDQAQVEQVVDAICEAAGQRFDCTSSSRPGRAESARGPACWCRSRYRTLAGVLRNRPNPSSCRGHGSQSTALIRLSLDDSDAASDAWEGSADRVANWPTADLRPKRIGRSLTVSGRRA